MLFFKLLEQVSSGEFQTLLQSVRCGNVLFTHLKHCNLVHHNPISLNLLLLIAFFRTVFTFFAEDTIKNYFSFFYKFYHRI